MTNVYLNQIATSVPDHDVHQHFVDFVPSLLADEQKARLFRRMANRAQIEHRYSFFKAGENLGDLETTRFYRRGAFPNTAARMKLYKTHALPLICRAVDQLVTADSKHTISHVIVTSCTGFYAPGLDLQIVEHYGMSPTVERSMIGFMGCYAAFNALKLARHIVRSEPTAKVLTVNLELCTLHLQETADLEQILSFLLFADGCAASLVSSDPVGLLLESFYSTVLPSSAAQITWHIGQSGFDMQLSGAVPHTIAQHIPQLLPDILGNVPRDAVRHWAIHPGGRSILDSVQEHVGLTNTEIHSSREILRRYGNMSSATIMFILKDILEYAGNPGAGCAMAFGPGVTVESMRFVKEAAANEPF
ncbi:MAG: type III polyketide synthase [Methylobacter sp.]